jgi:hypothetical protein
MLSLDMLTVLNDTVHFYSCDFAQRLTSVISPCKPRYLYKGMKRHNIIREASSVQRKQLFPSISLDI